MVRSDPALFIRADPGGLAARTRNLCTNMYRACVHASHGVLPCCTSTCAAGAAAGPGPWGGLRRSSTTWTSCSSHPMRPPSSASWRWVAPAAAQGTILLQAMQRPAPPACAAASSSIDRLPGAHNVTSDRSRGPGLVPCAGAAPGSQADRVRQPGPGARDWRWQQLCEPLPFLTTRPLHCSLVEQPSLGQRC